jgi:hypothetical protein
MDISTRPNRQKAVALINRALTAILLEEDDYIMKVPFEDMMYNEDYDDAIVSVEALCKLIECLTEAYFATARSGAGADMSATGGCDGYEQ